MASDQARFAHPDTGRGPRSGPGAPDDKIFNAPLVAVLLALSMPALFFVQEHLPDQGLRWAFEPASLIDGGWWPGVVAILFLHANWAHALINAAFAFAFGPPVARLFPGGKGAAIFLCYYIVCGLIGTLGFGLMHLGSDDAAVGASGAVSGLMGGAIRLLGSPGRLRPLTDRRVIAMSAAIVVLNVATGLIGFAPGVDGAKVAWEAHAFGFLAGLLLIGPLARWFGTTKPAFASPAGMGDPRG